MMLVFPVPSSPITSTLKRCSRSPLLDASSSKFKEKNHSVKKTTPTNHTNWLRKKIPIQIKVLYMQQQRRKYLFFTIYHPLLDAKITITIRSRPELPSIKNPK